MEPVELWLAALRSGEYKQGYNFLCRQEAAGERHCCLGVLCEVYIKATGDNIKETKPVQDWYNIKDFDGKEAHLPEKVILWSGLSMSSAGKFPGGKALSTMNDGGMPFSEIADYIEKNHVVREK